jgi:hypothetical protein
MWCLQTIVAQNEKAHESGKHTPATKRIVSVLKVVGYQVAALAAKQAYYKAAGDIREVKWDVAKDTANLQYRDAAGEWRYGLAPQRWLLEIGASSTVPAKHSPKCKRAQERYDPDCPRCKGRFGAKRA